MGVRRTRAGAFESSEAALPSSPSWDSASSLFAAIGGRGTLGRRDRLSGLRPIEPLRWRGEELE